MRYKMMEKVKRIGSTLYDVAMHSLRVKGDERGMLRLKGLKKQARWRVEVDDAKLVRYGQGLK